MVTLRDYEKFERSNIKMVRPSLSNWEILIAGLLVFISAPFNTGLFFMLPLIGQGLGLIAFLLTVFYLWVRRSWKVTLVVIFSYLLFLIPFLIVIQAIKNRMDLVNFFILALGIPVELFYCGFVAARTWYLIEASQVNATASPR